MAQTPAPACPPPARPLAPPADTPLHSFPQIVAEALAVQRNPWQLRRRMTGTAFDVLLERVGVYRCAIRPQVRSVVLCRPAPAAVELCAVVDCGRRFRALAMRFEWAGEVWVCSRLHTD